MSDTSEHRDAVKPVRQWVVVALIGCLIFAGGCATAEKRKAVEQRVAYHYRLGMAHLNDNDIQQALVELRAAQDVDADDAKVLFALGHIHFQLGEYDLAEAAMTRIVQDEPGNGEAQNYLGNIYEAQGRLDAAATAFETAAGLPTYRTPHFALHNLGRVYLDRNQEKQAEQVLKKALRRVPEYYPARADLAKLYLDMGRWSEAADQWRQFLDIMPDLEDGYYYLARAYVGLGRPQSARDALTMFLNQAAPENPLRPDASALLDDLAAQR